MPPSWILPNQRTILSIHSLGAIAPRCRIYYPTRSQIEALRLGLLDFISFRAKKEEEEKEGTKSMGWKDIKSYTSRHQTQARTLEGPKIQYGHY